MHRSLLTLSAITVLNLAVHAHSAAADNPRYTNLPAGQFMKQWLVLGPVRAAVPGGQDRAAVLAEDYLASTSGEAEAAPRAGESQQIDEGSLEWQLVRSEKSVMDLTGSLGQQDDAIAYAYAELEFDQGSKVVLGLGSDDAVRVWLNGKLIHENSAGRPVVPDSDLVEVDFVKGRNRLLLKVQNYSGQWGYCCRALDAAGLQSRLVTASSTGDQDLVERLLSCGTNINAHNTDQLTALNAARIKGHQQLAEFLLSQGADPKIDPPSWETLAEKLLTGSVPENSPGVAVLVARDGEILFKSGYGFASLAHRVPVTPQTKFRIGSITKQFTAAAILKLQAEGKLSIEDTLDKYYADYPRGNEVTLRHLLTHTSGIHSYTSKPDFFSSAKSYIKPEKLIESFKTDPFDFDPGQSWSYSNSGYFLLGQLVAQVAQESYASFLEKHFFQPLGMKDTGVHHWATILEHEASGYAWNGNGFDKAMNWDMSRAGGAGAIYSTVEDLYRWNEAVFGGQVLDSKTLQQAFTPVPISQTTSSAMPYGHGWVISQQRGLQTIGHGGGLQGFVSHLIRFPEQKLTLVALVNAAPPPPGLAPSRLTAEIAELVLWQQMQPVVNHQVDRSVSPEAYAAYVGEYDYGTAIMTVTKEANRLFSQITGQPRWQIFPKSQTEFFWKVVDAQVTFVKNDSDQVTHAIHRQSGSEFKAAKLKLRKSVKVNAQLLENYVGKYDYGGLAVLTVTREDARLFGQMTGQPKFQIFAASENEFFWKVVNAEIKFVRDDEGRVLKAVHRQAGATIEAAKIE